LSASKNTIPIKFQKPSNFPSSFPPNFLAKFIN
jgi:hypothetical protein